LTGPGVVLYGRTQRHGLAGTRAKEGYVMRAMTELVRGEMAARGRTQGQPATPSHVQRELVQERARNAGLEQVIGALHERVHQLSAQLSELRAETA
jgi:hypothetical protein